MATAAQTKKLLSAMNKLLKEHDFPGQKITEIQLQPKTISALTSVAGTADGCPHSWQIRTLVITNGRAEWKCLPETKPTN
ncbi:MAG TPA: hypothetical protein PKC54_01750 [Ferruginibacter sp.]|nr:hypothetical protein [Ferruginibacter sp.]